MIEQTPSVTVTVGGYPVEVVDLSVTMDEAWSPYIQATIRCKVPDTLIASDPRVSPHVVIAFFTEYPDRVKQRAFYLMLRERDLSHGDGTMTLTATSREGRLIDYARAATTPRNPTATTLRPFVGEVLGTVLPGSVIATDTGATGPLDAAAAVWKPGVSAWDLLSPLVQRAGLRLWCDESAVWHLTVAQPPVPGMAQLSYLETITEADESISRDGEWADAIVMEYVWTNSAGATQTAYDVASVTGYSKALTIRHDTPFPGAGAAANVLARKRQRGRQQTIRAVSDVDVTPGMACQFTVPLTAVQTGYVSSVTFESPGNEMTVGSRELVDTPPTAWIFDPAGVSWQSIPVGVDWTEDI